MDWNAGPALQNKVVILNAKVVHAIAPYEGNSPLLQRQELFLESVSQAVREDVSLLALTLGKWQREGWKTIPLPRSAVAHGGDFGKPFIKDLFDQALEITSPQDWILYTNTDCAIVPGLYRQLRSLGATAVEYMRQDVEGNPGTLEELFSNARESCTAGLDGLALRAGFWTEIREHFPDFILGEPLWDPIYSGILRRIIPVHRDKKSLFHPKHEQTWSFENPSPGGRHNRKLFVEALTLGLADKAHLQDMPDVTDTAVISVSFGNDPLRARASHEGITGQLKQDLYCDFYLVEAQAETGQSAYSEDLRVQLNYIPVPCSGASQELFQKESLMNYAWKLALQRHEYDYFIFTDADIYSKQPDWFRQIRARLQENPSRAVQGYRMVKDTKDSNFHFSSLASAYVLGHQTSLPLNPGLCWGLHRSVLEMGNGFNSDCIECAGDSAFVAEYLNWGSFQYDPWLYQFDWFRKIEREVPFRVELDCVPVDIVHVHHGYAKERNYDGIRYAIEGFPPLKDIVGRDDHGLLYWKDADCLERELLKHRLRMSSREEVDRLFNEFAYQRNERKYKTDRSAGSTKPMFVSPGEHQQLLFPSPKSSLKQIGKKSRIVNVFNPAEVFRNDFPFSWCEGIKKTAGSTYIPINRKHNPFTLVLDGADEMSHMIGSLPIQPSWEPFDLSGFTRLNFLIRVSEKMSSDIKVHLTSKGTNDLESLSRQISLVKKGIPREEFHQFSVPLCEFENGNGFEITRTKLVTFIGLNSFRMELAKIYID